MRSFIQISHLTYLPPKIGNLPTRPILRDIELEIQAGEYLAVIGANGSGKTTLARQIIGLLLPTQGTVRVDGLDTRIPANLPQLHTRVGMAFQNPQDQLIATLVEEDVAFGPENLGLPPGEIRRRVDSALQKLGIEQQRLRPPHLLSAGQMQRVALAGILAMQPRAIIFDEATAMLDPRGRRDALEMMESLHQEGLTIIHITHAMEEAVRAERVVVLSAGQIVLDGNPKDVFSDLNRLKLWGLDQPPAVQVAQALRESITSLPEGLLTSKDLVEALPTYTQPILPTAPTQLSSNHSPLFVDVKNLGHVYLQGTPLAHRALLNANLAVRVGSPHAIVGSTGSGKSTLLQHLNGLIRPQEGSVRVGPYDFNLPGLDVTSARKMVGFVFQNPEDQFFEQYVGDEIAYGPRRLFPDSDLRERVRHAMQKVGLDFETFKDRRTFTLSGGEQRKVALASILALEPQVLILDEPTAGLDPAARRELLFSLRGMTAQGITLILSSHNLEDLPELVQDITVMQGGRDIRSGTVQAILGSIEGLQSSGLEPNTAVEVADGLRHKGWPIPADVVSIPALAETVRNCMQKTAL